MPWSGDKSMVLLAISSEKDEIAIKMNVKLANIVRKCWRHASRTFRVGHEQRLEDKRKRDIYVNGDYARSLPNGQIAPRRNGASKSLSKEETTF